MGIKLAEERNISFSSEIGILIGERFVKMYSIAKVLLYVMWVCLFLWWGCTIALTAEGYENLFDNCVIYRVFFIAFTTSALLSVITNVIMYLAVRRNDKKIHEQAMLHSKEKQVSDI